MDNVRRVCNAASKFGVSFHDTLMAGLDICQTLIRSIFRTRENQIALTRDAKEKFLHVKVLPSYCQLLRFLLNESNTKPVFMYGDERHIFGA